jgi:MFS family permease
MAISTALMALIPAVCNMPDVTIESYCFSNLWASAIPAIVLRCVQGFSAGAASGGINVIQSELWSTTERKGAIAQSIGVQNVSGATASMLAAAFVYGLRATMGQVRYAAWGWRICFLIVVPPSLLASYLMHKSTPESNDYVKRDGHVEEDALLVGDIIYDDENVTMRTSKIVESGDVQGKDHDQFIPDDEEATISIDDEHEHDYEHESSSSSTRGSKERCRRKPSASSTSLGHNIKDTSCRRGGDDNENENSNATPLWLLLSVLTFSQFAISAFNNLNVYLLDFVKVTYGVTANTATLMIVVGKAIQVMMTPFAATMADIKGWYWTSAFGGTLCTILALPMMVAGNFGGVTVAWILVSGCLPIVSTFWILNGPLLATSVFDVEHRSRNTSMVLATSAALAGFFPLVMEEIPDVYAQGGVLTFVAAFGTIGILWIKNRAKKGKVIIYQRPELY